MPELPDIECYLACLRPRIVGQVLTRIRVPGPFIVRSVDPPYDAIESHTVAGLRRLGKRIVIEFAAEPEPLFAVIHLMIAGRFQWFDDPAAKGPGRITQATFHFPTGTLALTEAGTKHRAALHIVRGEQALAAHDPGGTELMDPAVTPARFAAAIRAENRTLKRRLADPHLFAGIGNAYSDEILHAAKLSPVMLSQKLSDEQCAALLEAVRAVFTKFTKLLMDRFAIRLPGSGEITAFRPEFAAHGKYGKPCPVCGTAIQRIVHAENETNYCPRCQTGGKLLADRSLSRLLKGDWPKTIEEWEQEGPGEPSMMRRPKAKGKP